MSTRMSVITRIVTASTMRTIVLLPCWPLQHSRLLSPAGLLCVLHFHHVHVLVSLGLEYTFETNRANPCRLTVPRGGYGNNFLMLGTRAVVTGICLLCGPGV